MFESELALEVLRCHEYGRPERETGGGVRPILEGGCASVAFSGGGNGNWGGLRCSSGETLESELVLEVFRCHEYGRLTGGIGGGVRPVWEGRRGSLDVASSGIGTSRSAKSSISISSAAPPACTGS